MVEPKAAEAPVGTAIPLIDTTNLEVIEAVESIDGDPTSYVQTVPSMLWIIGHSLGHRPTQLTVQLDDDPVPFEVTANETNINVVLPEPKTGRVEFV